MPDVARPPYDEFGLFHENAAEFGLPYSGPPSVARTSVTMTDGRQLSALRWQHGSPEFVFLHGGAQNAHTWDTVALALNRPLLAIDLPGHGYSDQGVAGFSDPESNATDVAEVVGALAPHSRTVIGMSLGGLTTIALCNHAPELVRSVVLVDITPGVNAEKSVAISNFVNGPASFENFDELLARTIEHNPTRTVASLRRGILHNAVQREDGSWVWRYARFRFGEARQQGIDFGSLWDALAAIKVPLLLVRGMLAQSVVDDEDEAELLRRLPHAEVVRVHNAGHSVQGDTPVELAAMIADFVDRSR
jgi:pimeloyl-ACP methyl ester carboxylesterase